MKTHKQLTQYQRYYIRIYLKAGYSQSKIAQRINVHRSTVRRIALHAHRPSLPFGAKEKQRPL